MADITKRSTRRLAAHFEPGELVHAALLCEPKGTYGVGTLALAAMPRTTDRHLADRAAAERAGLASLLPGAAFALVVTSDRILVSRTGGIRFEDPSPIYEHEDVFAGDLVSKGLGRRLTLVFADGSATDVDLQRGQPVERVIELLGPAPKV
ncbi:MAG: hypothetical protein AAGE98_04535 [Actinomycetota bacterium]